MRMRRTSGLLTAILVGLSVAGATPAAAQSQFVEVDYMKVAPGQDDAYLQVEQKMWKPIHEARVEAGGRPGTPSDDVHHASAVPSPEAVTATGRSDSCRSTSASSSRARITSG